MCYISACRQGFTDRQFGEIASRKHSTLRYQQGEEKTATLKMTEKMV